MPQKERVLDSFERHAGSLSLLILLTLGVGCAATNGLVTLAHVPSVYCRDYKTAYQYKEQLALSYTESLNPDFRNADAWASISLRDLRDQTNSPQPKFQAHRGKIPEVFVKQGTRVPIVSGDNFPQDRGQNTNSMMVLVTNPAAPKHTLRVRVDDTHTAELEEPQWKESRGWAYPLIIIGFGPALAFDIATCPIQFFIGMNKWFKSITG